MLDARYLEGVFALEKGNIGCCFLDSAYVFRDFEGCGKNVNIKTVAAT